MYTKDEILFRIKNLKKYPPNAETGTQTLIEIPELIIPKQKLVVLLGESGSGKTTFLEILGLMSYPNPGSTIEFYPDHGEPISYGEIWKNEILHSRVLQEYFSFAFQQQNLINKFSLAENLLLPRLISKNENVQKSSITQLLHSDTYDLSKRDGGLVQVNTLSGGEQQRATFARIHLSDYEVLFADEPTGNLGKHHAQRIFQLIRQLVDVEKKSAIIVTHDIELATQYADFLVVISKNGLVPNSDFMFRKEEKKWSTGAGSKISTNKELFEQIQNRMKDSSYTKSPEDGELKNLKLQHNSITLGGNSQKGFQKLFIKKDYSFFKNSASKSLFWICFVAIFAVSFSEGSKVYLKSKMSDPFVNILTARVPDAYSDNFTGLKSALTTKTMKDRYHVDHVSGFSNVSMNVYVAADSFHKPVWGGRTIEYNDPLLTTLQQPEFRVNGASRHKVFQSPRDTGFIVSEQFISKYGYSNKDSLLTIRIPINDENYGYRYADFPIIGVFKHVPGNWFLVTPYFAYLLDRGAYSYQHPSNTLMLSVMPQKQEILQQVKTDLQTFLSLDNTYSKHNPYVFSTINQVRVNFRNGKLSDSRIQKCVNNFKLKYQNNNIDVKRFFPVDTKVVPDRLEETKTYKKVAIKLSSLQSVEDLKEFLLTDPDYRVELDIEKVMTQKNYYAIARLLTVLSLFIIILAIISTGLFVYKTFYIHIFRQRTQLGILKSMGAQNMAFRKIFRREILKVLAQSIGISIVAVLLIDQLLSLKFINLTFLENADYLNLVNFWTIALIASIAGISIYASQLVLNKLILRPPGDLIYDRLD